MLTRREVFWGIIAVVLVGLLVVHGARNFGMDPHQIDAAATVNTSDILVDGLRCLSIDPNKVVANEQPYWEPELVDTIGKLLPVKTVLLSADVGTCPWGFFATVVPGKIRTVRLRGQAAEYLVSIGICERAPNGSLIPGKCINKNIYVFNSGLSTHELLIVGLVGLARSQKERDEVFRIARP